MPNLTQPYLTYTTLAFPFRKSGILSFGARRNLSAWSFNVKLRPHQYVSYLHL